MEKWIDKKAVISGLVVVVVGFLLYKYFVRKTNNGGIEKLEVVIPK